MTHRERCMTKREVQEALSELIVLRKRTDPDYGQLDLAAELEASESAICRWLKGDRMPNAPARKLIRMLLHEVRNGAAGQPA